MTIFLNLKPEGHPGKRVKVIQAGRVPVEGKLYQVEGCKNRKDAILALSNYLHAHDLEEKMEDLLDSDVETYTTLKRALRRVKLVICE